MIIPLILSTFPPLASLIIFVGSTNIEGCLFFIQHLLFWQSFKQKVYIQNCINFYSYQLRKRLYSTTTVRSSVSPSISITAFESYKGVITSILTLFCKRLNYSSRGSKWNSSSRPAQAVRFFGQSMYYYRKCFILFVLICLMAKESIWQQSGLCPIFMR